MMSQHRCGRPEARGIRAFGIAQTSLVYVVTSIHGQGLACRFENRRNAMKSLTSIFAVCASALIFTAACSKTDTPPAPTAAPQAQSVPEPQSPPSTPTAPMPPPDAPKGDASAGPKPGQANDHSSPAFKKGGTEVPK
jgi:hypothetical protein